MKIGQNKDQEDLFFTSVQKPQFGMWCYENCTNNNCCSVGTYEQYIEESFNPNLLAFNFIETNQCEESNCAKLGLLQKKSKLKFL